MRHAYSFLFDLCINEVDFKIVFAFLDKSRKIKTAFMREKLDDVNP